jgi:hypothetical protein
MAYIALLVFMLIYRKALWVAGVFVNEVATLVCLAIDLFLRLSSNLFDD